MQCPSGCVERSVSSYHTPLTHPCHHSLDIVLKHHVKQGEDLYGDMKKINERELNSVLQHTHLHNLYRFSPPVGWRIAKQTYSFIDRRTSYPCTSASPFHPTRSCSLFFQHYWNFVLTFPPNDFNGTISVTNGNEENDKSNGSCGNGQHLRWPGRGDDKDIFIFPHLEENSTHNDD